MSTMSHNKSCLISLLFFFQECRRDGSGQVQADDGSGDVSSALEHSQTLDRELQW